LYLILGAGHPDTPYNLGNIVKACLPRIVELGVATPEEIDIGTLQQRLDDERNKLKGIYIGDVIFGAWARKPVIEYCAWLCRLFPLVLRPLLAHSGHEPLRESALCR